MSNPVLYNQTTYCGKQQIYPKIYTASLIGCLVLPKDGSYSVVLKNGKMTHDSIAYEPTKHTWLVVAENGRFPTDYHITAQDTVKDDYTNDIMMVNPNDLNEIAFAQSRFMEIVSDPNVPLMDKVLRVLRCKHPQITWRRGECEKVWCEFSLQAMHVLIAVDRIVGIHVQVANFPGGPVITVEPTTNWNKLINN